MIEPGIIGPEEVHHWTAAEAEAAFARLRELERRRRRELRELLKAHVVAELERAERRFEARVLGLEPEPGRLEELERLLGVLRHRVDGRPLVLEGWQRELVGDLGGVKVYSHPSVPPGEVRIGFDPAGPAAAIVLVENPSP